MRTCAICKKEIVDKEDVIFINGRRRFVCCSKCYSDGEAAKRERPDHKDGESLLK